MRLEFNPETGVVIPSTAEIRNRIATGLQECFARPDQPVLDTEPSTPAGQMVDLITAEIQSVYASFAYYVAQLSPVTAEGRFQDAFASLYSIVRKTAQPTIVACVVKGLAGTVIPYGAQVKTSSGVVLSNLSNVTIEPNGKATVFFRTIEWGEIPVPRHSVDTIVTTVAGWSSVDNEVAGVLGRERENHAELESRRLRSVARNSHGAAISVEGAIANIEDVIDTKVLENITNEPVMKYGVSVEPHSLAISVFGGSDEDIAKAIYLKKDGGCGTTGSSTIKYKPENNEEQTYRIIRPTPTATKIKVVFKADRFSVPLQNRVKEALIQDFLGRGSSGNPRIGMAQTVFAFRFVNAVVSVIPDASILEIQVGLKSAGFGSSVDINATQEPTLSADDITLEFR